MNSMSRNNNNFNPCFKRDRDDCCKRDHDDCCKGHHDDCDCKKNKKFCPTILKCGCPGSAVIQGPLVVGTTSPPATVSSVSVDTSRLCDPCVKLEFASVVSIPLLVTAATITFQVFKICGNQLQRIPVGPQWTFSRLIGVGSSDTFTFFVCDCGSCNDDCCTYVVEAVATSLIGVGAVSISNATLSAIATCSTSNCC